MATKKKFYAVRKGRNLSIYQSWEDCKKQVAGYPRAEYKGFADFEEAKDWLDRIVHKENKNKKHCTKYKNISKEQISMVDINVPADYIIYTDGSCLFNPGGPGGWAAVILNQSQEVLAELCEGSISTTNNRMELTAAQSALEFIPEGAMVDLYTDSQYLKNAFTKNWLANWKRRGWKTATGAPVKNQDLWAELSDLFDSHIVRFHWVKGHSGIKYNERCDELAGKETERYKQLSKKIRKDADYL